LNKRKLFLLNRSLHRDLGYLSIGLTIVFALSGLAINHRDDWNPNYSITRELKQLDKVITEDREIILAAKKLFSIKTKVKGQFWINENQFKVFFPNETTVVFNKVKKTLQFENIKPRLFLRAFNGLHLNELKGYWIFISDAYSLCLLYLAISALFMVKGKYGIVGRGGVLTAIGLIIPLYFTMKVIF
jgi:hypothetical protein